MKRVTFYSPRLETSIPKPTAAHDHRKLRGSHVGVRAQQVELVFGSLDELTEMLAINTGREQIANAIARRSDPAERATIRIGL